MITFFKYLIFLELFISLELYSANPFNSKSRNSLQILIDSALYRATKQSILMANTLKNQPGRLPKTINIAGFLETSSSDWWCSGFFPGTLWYLYENNQDEKLKLLAHNYTLRVENQKYNNKTHDVGFMIFCSYGNAYRLTGDTSYRNVIRIASQSLSTRFNQTVGCIRSWDYANWNKQWQFPVIIDNMMNLEMLMWASREFGIQEFSNIAISHAVKTLKNHYRKDFSCYHVVSYDTLTGIPLKKNTAQGYSHESSWARGQAWGLYGYTMMYRESGDSLFLKQATEIANYIINHPNMPEDKIPYWDLNAPDIPDAKRDASAATIICSALIELSTFVDEKQATVFLKTAETQLQTLCSDQYLAKIGENGNFILMHGIGHMPNKTEIDVPLSYADYYFIEAITRYKKMILKK